MIENGTWLELYQAALLELRPEQLSLRIAAAELAIRQRMLDLQTSELQENASNSEQDIQALRDALLVLRTLTNTECRGPELKLADSAGERAVS